jgi:hypothetical protein
MAASNNEPFWQSRRKILVIYAAFVAVIMAVVLLAFLTNIFETSEVGAIPQVVWFLAAVLFLLVFILLLAKVFKILSALEENGDKLERIAELLKRNSSLLEQVDQGVRLSETAKAVQAQGADKQSLREAVFDKLQEKDFKAANEIIDEIALRDGYKELAEQLRTQANTYRDSTDRQRIEQATRGIEKLFESCAWTEAAEQIESLIKTCPNSEQVKALRQRLQDKKQERKKLLLNSWDDAVKRGATDRSLEILKELDLYLTPNEGLALQEAAMDVFKAKLHNLGVQFSLAISGKNWTRSVEIGRQIVRDFPNSKIAGEIREKMDMLGRKVEQQPS